MKKLVITCRLSILVAFLVSGTRLSGQGLPAAAPIIPLSPNAAELNKYTSIPVNAMNGIPSISFPLYEINTGKIKLPITLSYHAGGIKVNQRATWVGLGWSLNAGGTISRAVRGDEDETEDRGWFNDTTPWSVLDDLVEQNLTGTAQERADAYYELANNWAPQPSHHDTHPDFFSYNAGDKSGKFIYSRAQQKFVSFPFQPVKIKHFPVTNTYTITDDDGTVYYYEAKETTMYFVGPANAEQEYVQSWYLTKIESADGTDIVQLSYNFVGYPSNPEIVKSYSRTYSKKGGETFYSASAITLSESQSFNSVLVLTDIIFPQGKVSFYANTVRKDYQGKALDSIVVYSNKDGLYERVRKFAFEHDYFMPAGYSDSAYGRLRLLSFSEKDIVTGSPVSHQFEYNPTALPLINSNSADYWGYYNGATNGSLLPNVLPLQELAIHGNVGDASRNASAQYMIAGTLQKILYPTGGFAVFEFEPNKYLSDDPGTKSESVTSLSLYGTGMTQEATQQVNFQFPQSAVSNTGHLHITFSPYQPGGEGIPQELVLRDVTTSTNVRTWEHTGNGQVTQIIDEDYQFDKTHQYRLIATIRNNTQTYIWVDVNCQVPDSSTFITNGAGLRCKTIKTYDSDSSLKLEEVYKYGENESGLGMPLLSDNDLRRNYYTQVFIETVPPAGSVCCPFVNGHLYTYVGSTSYPSFSFLGSTVLYEYVTKYQIGNGQPNGKTVQRFKLPNDFRLLANPRLIGGHELLDNSLFDQQLIKETKYAYKQSTNSYYQVEEQELKYKKYNAAQENAIRFVEMMAYVFNSSCPQEKVICLGASILRDFHFPPYYIQLGCYRVDSIYSRTYDPSGNFVQKIQVFEYENGQHLYATGISTINSKNELLKTITKYPGDHSPSDLNSSVLDKMVLLNKLQEPYWTANYKDNALLKYIQTTFNNQWNTNENLVLPQKQELYINKTASNLSDFREFKSYDSHGNPLRITSTNGIYKSYVWDYLFEYPIAELVSNQQPTLSEIAYTSFEADGLGNWVIGSALRDTGSITGKKCYQLSNGDITRNSLNTSTQYILTYWTKNNSAFNIAGTQGTVIQGRAVGDWKCFQHRLTGVSQLTISGNGLIDELRLYPRGAQMTSYTYEPLIGMTSQSDASNKIIYYEYDSFGRLKLIRDQDKNILKTFEYKYQANTNQ